MLTQEENDFLTRVGPGTPCGELLRRYWMPCALISDLTPEQPTKFVRLLGEDLVIFRDKSGRLGMLADHCSHRGASLLYGRVEERGIACAYHGWLYDTEGYCLETPAEPADSKLHLTVRQRAYPVREYVGLIWAYLGPRPAPEIPPYDVWARRDGTHKVIVQPDLDCNWLAPMENSVDGPHAYILHQEFLNHRGRADTQSNTTAGHTRGIAEWRYEEIPIGVMKTRAWASGHAESHPLIFPNMLRQANGTQIRVPIDDTHTRMYRVTFTPSRNGIVDDDDVTIVHEGPYKTPPDQVHPYTKFDKLMSVAAQDFMAWETQGPIADRPHERLATGDRGVVMFREILNREIEKVQQGLDPMCVIRDPSHPIIDTNLEESLARVTNVD